MEVWTVTSTWSPEADRYTLYTEPSGSMFEPEPFNSTVLGSILWELDEHEEETGRITGIEIHAFLEFEHWEDLKKIPGLWRFPGQEPPVPLDVLLKREQARLRETTPARLRR